MEVCVSENCIDFDDDKIAFEAMNNLEDYDIYQNAPEWEQQQMFDTEVGRIKHWYIDNANDIELQRLAAHEAIDL